MRTHVHTEFTWRALNSLPPNSLLCFQPPAACETDYAGPQGVVQHNLRSSRFLSQLWTWPNRHCPHTQHRITHDISNWSTSGTAQSKWATSCFTRTLHRGPHKHTRPLDEWAGSPERCTSGPRNAPHQRSPGLTTNNNLRHFLVKISQTLNHSGKLYRPPVKKQFVAWEFQMPTQMLRPAPLMWQITFAFFHSHYT